nr:reverse transcriptase domain-containing protein [Tanacetum cinerariifolium]
PEYFIHCTKKKKKRNPFIPVEDRGPKVIYLPFKNLFEALVVYNPFSALPFPMADNQPMWGNNRVVAPTLGAAIIAVDLGENFTVKVNPNAKTIVIHDDSEDEADEAEKEVESSSSKQTKSDPTPLKAYKPRISYPRCLCKEKMEERYAKFIDLIKEVRINVSLVNVLDGMPNYGKFLKDLVSNKSKMEQISNAFLNEECSAIIQNKLPPKLGDPGSFLIPCTLASLLEYLSLADLGTRINLMPYSLYALLSGNTLKPTRMKEELDALLIDYEPFLGTSEKINESSLNEEFEEFKAVDVEEIPKQEEEVEDKFNELPLEKRLRIKTSIQDPLTDLELKPLPKHLEYAFLDNDKPVIQRQLRLDPNMKKVMKKEIIKLLDTGIIYLIEDSPWVSPVRCVPKKGGITVVINEKNKLVPTRTVTGWHVCIDYRKLNEATQKDHFPLPFMDQMMERLAGNKFFSFLDGFYGYFQIPIEPADQEKTTFTCPYGTYVYKRMPVGLCNAPVTFQRCMIAIFQDVCAIQAILLL